jgi:glycosyltransferase involved in cell wall biosynthesis
MRIGLILTDMNEFGGAEEIAVTLAISLKQQGHQVSFISTGWVPSNNQYLKQLHKNEVLFVRWPHWIVRPLSHWPTKEKMVGTIMKWLVPLTYLLGGILFLLRRGSWKPSFESARGWLQRQIRRVIGPDRRKPLTRLLLIWWRWRWCPDLLHIHGYANSLLYVIDWAYSNKLPVVYEEHQTPDTQFDWWQGFQQSINKTDVVVAVSGKSAEALRTICGITQPIVVMNPNVLDPITMGWQRNAKLRQNDELHLTTVARLYVTKGLIYLLEAIAQVKTSHPVAQFKVYGDGPLRQELLAYADKLGLDGNEIFVGAFTRPELPAILAQTDIFVIPSILEGQPLVLVEAMAFSCPIVTTSVGGIPELIEDGVNGLLCPPANPTCLAQKICLLIEDSALRQRLALAARQSYEQGPFQPATVCDQFVSIYQKVLQNRMSQGNIVGRLHQESGEQRPERK